MSQLYIPGVADTEAGRIPEESQRLASIGDAVDKLQHCRIARSKLVFRWLYHNCPNLWLLTVIRMMLVMARMTARAI